MVHQDIRKTLGRARKLYRGASVTWTDFLLRALPGVLVPLVFLTYGTYVRIYGYAQASPYADPASIWFVIAAFSLLPFAVFSLRRFFTSRQAVVRYDNGLRLIHLSFKQDALLWQQIRGLRMSGSRYHFFGLPISDRLSLSIELFHGETIHLPRHLQGLSDLGAWIKKEIYPLLLPAVEEELQNHRPLSWGPITVHKDHFNVGQQTILWTKVTALRVESGRLVVEAENLRPLQFPTESIPNLELLLTVAARLIDHPTPTSAPQPGLAFVPQE